MPLPSHPCIKDILSNEKQICNLAKIGKQGTVLKLMKAGRFSSKEMAISVGGSACSTDAGLVFGGMQAVHCAAPLRMESKKSLICKWQWEHAAACTQISVSTGAKGRRGVIELLVHKLVLQSGACPTDAADASVSI